MDTQRIQALLQGDMPSLEDYSLFVSVVEKLPIDLLWDIAHNTPDLNGVLRIVVTKTLQERVARKNIDDALDGIVISMRHFLK